MARRTLYTESFTAADQDPLSLGGGWGSGYSGGGVGNMQIVGNNLQPSLLASGPGLGTYATAVPNDHWCSINVSVMTGSASARACVRWAAPTAVSGYYFVADGTNMVIHRADTGTFTQLATAACGFTSLDVYLFEAIGTTIAGYRNDTLIVSTTDATYAAGRVGASAYAITNLSDLIINTFLAGDFTGVSLIAPPHPYTHMLVR